jgi:serine/threonine-protein kinase RsbW
MRAPAPRTHAAKLNPGVRFGAMTPATGREFAATKAGLPEALAFVEAFCSRRGVARGDLLRLTLVVEELFTNTVEHGRVGEASATIRLGLDADPAELKLLYEDAAAPFDALAHLARQPPRVDAPVEACPVGGLGLQLVDQFAASLRYAREAGRNRLWIALRREA